ncbi:MAG: TetR/AcrR family transcriptional regulator [Acidobacteria bacterium]|nr:TetR/AcrR family transcriptional regulator [Acidobacteriota bacterium]
MSKLSRKGPETLEKILEAALDLFREKGFEGASMRDIANRAEVSTGLAYYYFNSKDAIVLAFYDRAYRDLLPKLEEAQTGKKLAERLERLIAAKFEYFAPNRRFLGALMGHAADPASPLSPFGEPSRKIRDAEIEHFARALRETQTSVAADLEPHLPKLLWMYQMSLILFWMYDASENQARATRLLTASLRMAVMLIRLAALPLMKPARKVVLELVEIVES